MRPATTAPNIPRQGVAAAVIGNALEWFDLVTYGFFAPVIAHLFFPSADPSVSLVYALGTFGVSFLVRPVGALVIGRFADRAGRRAALVLVTTLMFGGTFLIAVIPTYAQIGVVAPVLLLIARLIQGFSAGGEFGSATAYLAEQSASSRGFYSSWQFAGQGMATLMASAIGLGLGRLMDERMLYAWGWRIPFVLGLLIGPVAYLIRQHAPETPEFAVHQTRTPPAAAAMAGRVGIGCGLVLLATVSMYLMLYMPTFAQTVLHLDSSVGFAATFAAGTLLIVVPPLAGAVSDRIGRVRVALPAALILTLASIPAFLWLIDDPSATRVVLVQAFLCTVAGVYLGALPALLSELFVLSVRTTGISLSYNIAVVTAGGFAPMLVALLVRSTGSHAAPGFYLAGAAGLSFVSVLCAVRWAGAR